MTLILRLARIHTVYPLLFESLKFSCKYLYLIHKDIDVLYDACKIRTYFMTLILLFNTDSQSYSQSKYVYY